MKALVVSRALLATGVGLSAGVASALQGAPLLASFLYGVAPADAFTFIAATGLLVAIAAVASLLPARAVSRIDPAVVLRIQ